MDTRLQELTDWVRQIPGFSGAEPATVSGDASFRRYFRVTGQPEGRAEGSFIVMDAPPEREDCAPFAAIARHWRSAGIRVPEILAEDGREGFLLLEDFGDRLLLGELDAHNADRLYQGAMEELLAIQQVTDAPGHPLPPYDEALLDREMALFPDWLLEGRLGLTLSNGEKALLDTTFACLRESALAQPQVPVHRDYHSRNLLVLPGDNRPGVIDFQDAVTGPVTYDLVSLLRDCYIRWPSERVETWLEHYRVASREAGLHRADSATFRQWFDLMGMQRHLKAAGIFARLSLRDGKHDYLRDIPRTIGYLLDTSSRQASLRHFHDWLATTVAPAVAKQPGREDADQ